MSVSVVDLTRVRHPHVSGFVVGRTKHLEDDEVSLHVCENTNSPGEFDVNKLIQKGIIRMNRVVLEEFVLQALGLMGHHARSVESSSRKYRSTGAAKKRKK